MLKHRHRVLGFLCLLAAITYLDRVAISVAGPRIQESLNISPEMWGWVVGIFTVSYAKKHVGAVLGAVNTVGSVGGFLFSVSFGYFVTWFGAYDLALIPVALMLTLGTLLWFRIDATEELIPEPPLALVPAPAVSVLR